MAKNGLPILSSKSGRVCWPFLAEPGLLRALLSGGSDYVLRSPFRGKKVSNLSEQRDVFIDLPVPADDFPENEKHDYRDEKEYEKRTNETVYDRCIYIAHDRVPSVSA